MRASTANACILGIGLGAAWAAPASADATVPRELSTDRPDKTESAYSVDAGRVQVEMDVVTYGRDEVAGVTAQSWTVGGLNAKVGLRHDLDLQLVTEAYTRVSAAGAAESVAAGTLTARVKWNAWGNDRGRTALAVMPFVAVPTRDHPLVPDLVEAGVIVPFAMALPREWGLGVMAEVDWVSDEDGEGRHLVWVQTATVSHAIVGELGGYVELFAEVSADDTPVAATFDLGATYALSDDVQLDAGINLGLTEAAEDLNPFLGLTLRR